MKKQHIKLTPQQQQQLVELIEQGDLSKRKRKRARALLELDQGKTYEFTALTIGMSPLTLSRLAIRFHDVGLGCLHDKPRPGRPAELSAAQLAKIVELAHSTPPQGQQRWSLRQLATQAVELGYVEQISHTTIANILANNTR